MAAAAATQRLLAVSTKIVGVGRNYVAHAKELGNPVPKEPSVEVPEPLVSLHHEIDLAIVISRRARDVPEASAMYFVGAVDSSKNATVAAAAGAHLGLPI